MLPSHAFIWTVGLYLFIFFKMPHQTVAFAFSPGIGQTCTLTYKQQRQMASRNQLKGVKPAQDLDPSL